jgi:hypothetical protein
MDTRLTGAVPASIIVDTARIQYVAIAGSIVLLLFILALTRKGKIKVQYALLWFFVAGLFLAVSIWRDALDAIAQCVGVAYPPAALFLLLIMGIVGILIHFSIVLSSLSERTRALVQEMGILKLKLQRRESGVKHSVSAPSSDPREHE